MKCYLATESIRLTGKGWEIRHYLRGIVASAPSHMTLSDWVDRDSSVKSPSRVIPFPQQS